MTTRLTNDRLASPFIVFSLPRSRSAWLSRFLTYGDWVCGHEQLRYMRGLDDLKSWFAQPMIGSVETAAAPFWRSLEGLAPDARLVVLRRPVDEVVASFMSVHSFDPVWLRRTIVRIDMKLAQIEKRLAVMSVTFADLDREEVCGKLFEHCLHLPFDRNWWETIRHVNVQIDLRALFRYFAAHQPQLDKLAAMVRHRTLADFSLREADSEDVTFQSESFDDWLRDGTGLFAEHLVQVGEGPDEWQRKNIPLMRKLYDVGAMEITTARSNGRMFGYLMTLVTPSLTSPGITSAANTTFFASPDFKNLGIKLQRHALKALRERGVNDVFWEAGKRGSGPKLGALYRRLGAVEHGTTYRLELTGS